MLNYTREGQGKTIVFLHGFCESIQIWDFFKPYFIGGYEVVCLDLPGHGKSEGLGYETTIEKIAFQVNETLDSLQIAKPIIIGHSLGGYVGLAYAEMYPEKLAGLCLFHSSAFADAPEKKENRNKTIDYVEKHGVEAFSNPFVPNLFFHKRREILKEKIEYATQIARKMTVENIANATRAMRDRKETLEVLKESKVPIAFIVGKEDSAVTLNKSLEQCQLPSISHTLFLGETGHMGMFERPEECKSFLSGFLKACK